ncbi:bifunctional diaminohydroxyphosphoribosylaminopyrimidine deaminase/5-amino-6-(5-phosphoribosylamino)uracil reductase RibD [Winogradskyella immobilis]|uniref:Riboflavin biosynthesis protein RibD n=1 Tax=Winogradskyella immobilis TaxID=2816852 RepID=A0ABS8ENK3_9FLAO|nr:bifunctional diaminohydroxyphosphoribosylaminopyrimidine deaminase/5-amino-6-(5-phosphoribosylamino)uracil reductase RibD [Winogradskyella immobilis]MCC1484788.1 bifunctional diaminohydroxyphosphoribosylaminopyrimidine deaminase/5-amino-6-(5-phosphoribosylamino)uracil reductase RibD [Winogradskyella immobilis]MCG0016880.1 bifunctional diaminohydroxyphosphoribosylaminopyrimidine deaminase/5-amino-6-(5-phosphoribosylamino)uracil reductase RibD [Winogradskyella immobilis]
MNIDEVYIKRCIQIAKNGLGTTRPNPMVGAIIVFKDKIIGEGFTSAYGGSHAEVNAIKSVTNKHLLSKATLYVTLEPCSHYGKTPPCSDLIIEHNIPNVVIGCVDDNPEVAGKGIRRLKAAGCNVTVGVLEAECKAHHKRFFTFHNRKRPYVILKWAETSNGFISPKTKAKKAPVWITNLYSRQLAHKWRAEEQSILVGTNTVLEDNPSLTVRDWTGEHPTRIVIDRQSKLSSNHNIFNDKSKTITLDNFILPQPKDIAQRICTELYKNNINSVIIEGGLQTLQTFINENLWDEAYVFKGVLTFNDGIKAPEFSGNLISEKRIANDTLKHYENNS